MHSTQEQHTLARFAAANTSSEIADQSNLKKITGGSAAQASIVMEDDIMFIIEETGGL